MAFKCEKCEKEFKNDLALKIHVGRIHGSKKAKKAKAVAKKAAGTLTCEACGRSFGHPAHLARHVSVAHKKGRKPGKKAAKGRPAAASAQPVDQSLLLLTIDELIGLKQQVDARLAQIAKQLRSVKL